MNSEKSEIKYPVGIQSFSEIREGGYLYVDKTAFIRQLLKGKYYFLSRPRRFGKSLLISTLEAYFLGRRELFKGLALDSLTENWEPHPVFHLDLNNGAYTSPEGLTEQFNNHLNQWEKEYGQLVDRQELLSPSIRFGNIIKAAFKKTGKQVVILVDEYDKPMLNAFGDEKLVELFRTQLKTFYSNLKTMDAYIKLAMLTGVARFSKVSIFSDLNNLRDISYEDQFSTICGVTAAELDTNFLAGMKDIAAKSGISTEEVREKLRENYDGYHFSPESPDIYNPFSLLNAFAKVSIGTYWSESATPEFLVSLLRQEDWNLSDLAPCQIDSDELETSGVMSENPIPVLYQTGYLTIKDYDPVFGLYTLDYPNEEVRKGFLKFLIPLLSL